MSLPPLPLPVVAVDVVAPAPPEPPPPPAPLSVVRTSSVARPCVASWNEGANELAIGPKSALSCAIVAASSVPDTSSTMPSVCVVGPLPAAGMRAPFALTTSSIVSVRRVAWTVSALVASNHGNEWPAYTPPHSGSVGVAGATTFSSTPNGGTSAVVARPIK